MSFADELVKLGIKAAGDPDVIRAAVDYLRPVAREELPESLAGIADTALALMAEKADVVAHIGVEGLIGLAGRAEHGDVAARALYIRHHATVEEVLGAQDAAHEATMKAEADSVWADVWEVVTALTPVWKSLLPLIVAAI